MSKYGNRKAATEEALKWVSKILPNSPSLRLLEQQLNGMDDSTFHAFIQKLKSGETVLPLTVPNLNKPKLSVERNFKIGHELGYDFFQRLWLTDGSTGVRYLTPKKYLVLELPVRRQQQALIKKISIPAHNRTIDDLTGQPTGDSKGAAISFPELQVMYAQNLDRSIEEFIKFRGGDLKAMRKMYQQLIETGHVSQDAVKTTMTTKVRSTQTLSTYLKAMHIQNTL